MNIDALQKDTVSPDLKTPFSVLAEYAKHVLRIFAKYAKE